MDCEASDEPPKTSQRFPRSVRILKSADFERTFRCRAKASDQHLLLFVADNATGSTRLGVVVSRKCGSAVIRNRWKRGLREAFRTIHAQLPPQLDLVVLPNAPAVPSLRELQASLLRLTQRAARKLPPASTPPEAEA